ncbi:excalibur calcium-binding domain-containing protein [Virgisporangium aliadipatigenens]|uniref:excalibur calcium-binding domain-containing protein n=1 Tax=Virgisporangium aliadipatigenens TaxID=741659 RepID=UPI001EF1A0DB|nr:excalibur calcium-binding domain-containing protein [Virgisporangium aliadipatigenens]
MTIVLSITGGVLALCAVCAVFGAVVGEPEDKTPKPAGTTAPTTAPAAAIEPAASTSPTGGAAATNPAAVPAATTGRPPAPAATTGRPPAPPATTGGGSVYYKNCDEVRRAGKAPLYKGQPGYRSGLDRDGDGIACDT